MADRGMLPFADEPAPADLPHLLNPEEVASYLRIPRRTVDGWRQAGSGPPYVRLGRAVRYPAPQLREWIERHTSSAPDRSEASDE